MDVFRYESEIPNYRTWTAAKNLSILIYSGDADFILNHMGSVNWITQGLQNKQTKPWTKWRGSDGQVAGYYEEFDGLTFLTVKGAGKSLSGSISTVLTSLSWICVGIHSRRALPSPVCA